MSKMDADLVRWRQLASDRLGTVYAVFPDIALLRMHHALTIPELLGMILQHLYLPNQARMAHVCRRFFSAAVAYI